MFCDLCLIFQCSQGHILSCQVISQNLNTSSAQLKTNISLDMIYGDVEQQLVFIEVFQDLVETRNRLLEEKSSVSLDKRSQGTED